MTENVWADTAEGRRMAEAAQRERLRSEAAGRGESVTP